MMDEPAAGVSAHGRGDRHEAQVGALHRRRLAEAAGARPSKEPGGDCAGARGPEATRRNLPRSHRQADGSRITNSKVCWIALVCPAHCEVSFYLKKPKGYSVK